MGAVRAEGRSKLRWSGRRPETRAEAGAAAGPEGEAEVSGNIFESRRASICDNALRSEAVARVRRSGRTGRRGRKFALPTGA